MNILMFSNFSLPNSCADATRVFSLAQCLRESGHCVSLCGVSYKTDGRLNGDYKGFDYEMLQATGDKGIKSYKRIADLNKQISAYLSNNQKEQKLNAIILSSVYFDFAKTFINFAKKHNIALIVNAVEWYDKNNISFKGLFGKINYFKNRVALIRFYKKMGNIIAISNYLRHYYAKRGCNTITIPTVVDMGDYPLIEKSKNEKLTIAYAGYFGRKDYIGNALKALELLNETEKQRIEIHIYGSTQKEFKIFSLEEDFFDRNKGVIFIHGKIPFEEVKEKIAKADYTVLLRPNAKYANAGFPTKVGESMACGTPVIANITSDLAEYIIDGKTGFVCESESPQACAETFRKALNTDDKEYDKMRLNSREMAFNKFNYKYYTAELEKFLERIKMI